LTAQAGRILVVDDDLMNRKKISMAVQALGHDTEVAEDGKEALEKLGQATYDLVLLDILMPGMDGYAVLSEMKADPDLRGTPVIVISAVDDLESVVKAIELGAEDYLPKSFNPIILKARIGTYMERAQYRDQERIYHQQVERAKKRSDELLATLMPKQIARMLKANEKLLPILYEDVTVLFCDIVGFTTYSENNPPETVFAQLESLVGQFEDLVADHGMMKVKTIGDAFLATANLLQDLDHPVREAVSCGLEMVEAANRSEADWQVRVGIDHGPVIAGIIGRKNFQFDVWGDTVNTAARIEEVSKPGSVSVSGRAWQNLHQQARGRSLGMVDLKGKEPIEVIECQGFR
jgi:class 3 adenylate cyclase